MFIITCWIEHPVRRLDQTFTYLSKEAIEPGCRILVPFGKRELTGFVETCTSSNETEEELSKRLNMHLKYVKQVLDKEPLITEELHDLALWMRQAYLSTAISCFQAMLPSKIKPVSSNHHILYERWVKLSDTEVSLTPKQLEAYLSVKEKGEVRYSEFRKKYPNQARILIEKGALITFNKEKEAVQKETDHLSEPLPLLPCQKKAYEEIMNTNDEVYLIKGVTGSGKTEVYLHLAEDALNDHKQVLILVPEISLTPQMIKRVKERFGSKLAVYHSGLNAQQKYEQYKLVKEGKAEIVVGTRSAVFLPFASLGLIVMDEEHDASYKQENQPCYHARDIAIWRGRYHHCKVVLGSATPSLESYARALKHVYHLIEMNQRINHTLPEIQIVSMRKNMKKGGNPVISEELKASLQQCLKEHKQAILLLNRRGYHTKLRCRDCGEVLKCPHCDIAMSWHRDIHKLKCHTCGYEMKVPRICPYCGSTTGFTTYGFGTERLEAEVQAAFPDARILRMDADTTSRKDAHEKLLASFERHEADILLGTQMIAKGLDYPDVTLVGVINGDAGLARNDFRSVETTFDLLMQAAGRSGRSQDPGKVIYQVNDPGHYAVQCAARQDYETFFRYEMQFRHAGQYPPYTYLIALTVADSNQQACDHLAIEIKNSLHGNFKVIGIITLLKIQDKARDRIILKGRNLDEMREAIQKFLNETALDIKGLRIDVNPMVLE